MFNITKKQETFLLDGLDKNTTKMLEYGSGESTIILAKHVNKLVSVEHDINWFNKIKHRVPDNVFI